MYKNTATFLPLKLNKQGDFKRIIHNYGKISFNINQ